MATIGNEIIESNVHFITGSVTSGRILLAAIKFASATTNITITTTQCVSMERDTANHAQQQLNVLLPQLAWCVMCLTVALHTKSADVALASTMIQDQRNVFHSESLMKVAETVVNV